MVTEEKEQVLPYKSLYIKEISLKVTEVTEEMGILANFRENIYLYKIIYLIYKYKKIYLYMRFFCYLLLPFDLNPYDIKRYEVTLDLFEVLPSVT